MSSHRSHRVYGFSLVELVVVIVIMGILAAIAIPRLNRGARRAGASALKADLASLRRAVELYAAEHEGKYPTQMSQMMAWSDRTGLLVATAKDVGQKIVFGPYLQEMPALPVGSRKGATGVYETVNIGDVPPQGTASKGWWFNSATGDVRANLPDSDLDEDGVQYNTY